MLAKSASGLYSVLGKEQLLLVLKQLHHLVDVGILLDAGSK
jgi:hypothetical protein